LTRLLLIGAATFASACSSFERNTANENIRSERTHIADGAEDSANSAVFFLQTRYASTSRRCTAFLVAPNLFLTARHCLVASDAALTCDSGFPDLADPSNLDLTNPTRVDSVEAESTPVHHGTLIRVPSGASLCGDDIALVMTDELVDGSPLALRLDDPPQPDEEYTAVGYGLLGELIGGEGTRRSRDALHFECNTEGCAPTLVDGEILGEDAPCEGDSGGPALDVEGRAVAVLSRGTASCTTPIYSTLFAHREWLRDVAKEASDAGGYALPAWSMPPQTGGQGGSPAVEPDTGGEGGEVPVPVGSAGEPPVHNTPPDDSGCSCALVGATRGAGGLTTVLGALLVAAAPLRRLRRQVVRSRSPQS
jgi:hypothetical protein